MRQMSHVFLPVYQCLYLDSSGWAALCESQASAELTRQIQLMLNHSNHPIDLGSGRGITMIPSQLGVLTAEQGVGVGPCP